MGWRYSSELKGFLEDNFDSFTVQFNPDQNTPEGLKQFVELIGKLDEKQIGITLETLDINKSFKKPTRFFLEIVGLFGLKQLEVCQAIIEVIKNN